MLSCRNILDISFLFFFLFLYQHLEIPISRRSNGFQGAWGEGPTGRRDRLLQSQPTPQLLLTDPIYIFADMEQLSNVIGHLVQNAIDATSKADEVVIKISQSQTEALIEIIDSGSGMDAQFIKTRLFKPFDSTKGLTGMGIGAYESREVIRALGGDIDVSSQIGLGSHFTVRLPLIME